MTTPENETTYIRGWRRGADIPPGVGGGHRFKRASGSTLPGGPIHAVDPVSREALCGAHLDEISEGEWPGFMTSRENRCSDCGDRIAQDQQDA